MISHRRRQLLSELNRTSVCLPHVEPLVIGLMQNMTIDGLILKCDTSLI